MNNFSKRLAGLSLGLLLTLGVGAAVGQQKAVGVKAEDDPLVYTLTPVAGKNNSYAGNCDIEVSKVTWNVNANTQGKGSWWRFGGKSITNTDRYFYSKTAINYNISKIDVEIGDSSSYSITVNSFTLSVYSTADDAADKTNPVSTVSGTFAYGSTVTFNRPDDVSWEGMFYRFTFNVTNTTTSNLNVQFNGAKFYGAEPVKPSIDIDNAISENLEINATGTLTATPKNITDPVVTWTSSNSEVIEINSSTGVYTAKAGGVATITASATGTGLSEPVKASFDVAVNYGTVTVAKLIEITSGYDATYTSKSEVTVTAYLVDLTSVSNSFVISDEKSSASGNRFNVYQIWSSHALRDIAVIDGKVTFSGNPATYKSTAQLTNISYSDYTIDAAAFANHFVSTLNADACADPTKDNTEALKTVWTDLKAKWAYVDSTSKGDLKDATAEDATYGSFVKLYDHIMNRYGEAKLGEGANFVGRSVTSTPSGANAVFAVANNSLTITIIVLVSVISVSLIIGTTLVIRKRKVN